MNPNEIHFKGEETFLSIQNMVILENKPRDGNHSVFPAAVCDLNTNNQLISMLRDQ